MRLINVDELVFDYSGLAYINPNDFQGIAKYFAEQIKRMPTIEPEPKIIHCRECKFASGDSRICMKSGYSPIGELDFCAWAERRAND